MAVEPSPTVERTAPDGARVTMALPPGVGALDWYGVTRMVGRRFARDFHIAPVGQHRVIPRKLLPDARETVSQRHGHDVILYEAQDGSDSCLVWAGPYNEATTWFGGPAPRQDVLADLVSAVAFGDSALGARLIPFSKTLIHRYGTVVIGRGEQAVLMVRGGVEGRQILPEWRGLARDDSEIWRAPLQLDEDQRHALEGTPFRWRYVIANDTSVAEVVFLPPGDKATASATSERDRITSVLSGIRTAWVT